MGVDSLVLTGGVSSVTGRMPVGLWGLFERFIAVLWTVTGVIGRFGDI
jgi:hypothetical protein